MPRKTVEKKTYVCCQCHNTFESLTDFYKTYSTLYTDTGHLPICKNCFLNLFNSYVSKYQDRCKAMQRVCMAFDLYYVDSLFRDCCKDETVEIGNYMKRLNIIQYQGKTFDTNISKGFSFGEFSKPVVVQESNPVGATNSANIEPIKEWQPKPTDIERWGSGFNADEYKELNSHYRYLKAANPNCDSNQEIFIIDLCGIKMRQGKALKDGDIDDYTKLTELYRKIFQQAGLKTVKDSTTSAEDCWSSWTGIISKTTPEEYYTNKELYKDMDGFDDYMTRHYLRPLNNLVNCTENRDSEFYIGDGADDE